MGRLINRRSQLFRFKRLGLLLGAIALGIFAFQNCTDNMHFEANVASTGSSSAGAQSVVPQFFEAKAGDDQSFPPLKLFFIVDNSGTMGVNQVNLGKAFEHMFDGDNATNLAPFDTSAYIISTTQKSVPKTDATFSKLPSLSIADIDALPFSDVQNHRASVVDGVIPGDLVGYQVIQTVLNGLNSIDFAPAPVVGVSLVNGSTSASVSAHKDRGGSVTAFAQDFRDRLAILDPARSALVVDPTNANNRVGVLDKIVDSESGLCSLARILKSNSGILNPGDLSAFIIVSDEDDNDPKGLSCLQSIKDISGNDDLIDGRCERPQTELSYHAAIANPTGPKCNVSYNRGFSYSVIGSVPQTLIEYSRVVRSYDYLRTNIEYYIVQHTWDTKTTDISYVTSAPTYEVPQTSVKYFTEVESCVVRDGVKTNCTYAYPSAMITLDGDYKTNCAAFVTGKLPAGALISKAGYEPTCSALANVKKTGACSLSNPNIVNCAQNYSTRKTVTLAGEPGAGTCAPFVAGKLPSGAVYTDVGYEPLCVTTNTIPNGPSAGACGTSGLINCVDQYILKPSLTYDGDYYSLGTVAQCELLAKSKVSTAVLGKAQYPVKCTQATARHVASEFALCPIGNANVVNCVESPEPTRSSKITALSTPFVQPATADDCLALAKKIVGTSIIMTGTQLPSCSAAADLVLGAQAGDELFSSSLWAAYDPQKGSACSQALSDYLKTKYSYQSVQQCSISSINQATQSFDNMTCAQANPDAYCSSSGGARRMCLGQEVPAGSSFETNLTMAVKSGTFKCDTLCSATTFCSALTGTVGDNFKDCSVKTASPAVIKSFVAELKSNLNICMATDTLVMTKGPYRSVTSVNIPVADLDTASQVNPLASYIDRRAGDLFKANKPSISVFVRQPGDPLGQNGSIGNSYNQLADLMGGSKQSVLIGSDGYAQSLKSLSGVIRERLGRSFSITPLSAGQEVHRVWRRKAGQTDWGTPIDPTLWSASAGTVLLAPDFAFDYGDEFKFEFY